uniref:Glutathione S-transferase 1 n=1 Tax=Lygus hesperus TaxID=30085 RepID=A0A0K8S887_LYGHE
MKICLVLGLVAVAAFCYADARRSPKKPDFYYFPPSPPCRLVMMAAAALKVDMNMKMIDLMKGEQLTPDFLKINPQHTIPVLTHDGLTISESRAIAAYLANSRPSGEKIYPKDPKKRAMVDQMLYFDMGKLYQRFFDLYPPMMFMGASWDKEKAEKLDEAVKMLEEYLTRNKWAAGNQMTLADISLLASVSTLEAVNYDFSKYPKIMAWSENSKKMIPDYEKVNEGVMVWKTMMDKYKQDHPM